MSRFVVLVIGIFFAFGAAAETWYLSGHAVELEACPAKHCRIQCSGIKDCLALRHFKSPLKADEAAEGGANPGSGVCRKLKGAVSIVEDKEKNQMALCRFSDGSLISLDGLWVW